MTMMVVVVVVVVAVVVVVVVVVVTKAAIVVMMQVMTTAILVTSFDAHSDEKTIDAHHDASGTNLQRAHMRNPHQHRPTFAVEREVTRHLQHRYQPVTYSAEVTRNLRTLLKC